MSVVLATFAGVLLIILGLYWALIMRPEATAHRALEQRLRPPDPAKKSRLTMSKAELQQRTSVFQSLQVLLDQSALGLTVPTLLFLCWLTGFVVGLAVWLGTQWGLLALGVGALASVLPYSWVRYKAGKRMWQFEEQFPEAIDLIARALRAGHAFPTGLSMVAEELSAPVGPEFKLIYDRQNFGMPLPDALRAFAERVPLLDARFFVTAVLTQRDAGGNLSGVLDNLATVIRERFKVKRQVRVVSAHGRITAAVLVALPPFVALAELVISPSNMTMLARDPLGVQMLIGAGTLQLLGMLVIRRIVKVEY